MSACCSPRPAFVLAGPLASFYGEPEVQPLFVVVSLGFLVSALGTTHMSLLVRDMEFRRLELRQIAATLVGAVVGITIAIADGGAWAIVGQQLAEAVTSTALLWYLTPWSPSFTFSRGTLRRLGGFAGNVFAENLLYQAGRSLSSLLIGRFLGASAVGVYVLATNVILVPFSRIAAPLQQVFFPAFSQMKDDRERLADVWIRATRMVGLVSIPSLIGLAIVAPDFVQVVLGPRWAEAIPVIQILALVGVIQSLQTLSGEVLLALDRVGVAPPLHDVVVRRKRRRFRARVAMGHRRRSGVLRDRLRPDRASAHVPRGSRARDSRPALRRRVRGHRAGHGGDGSDRVRPP